jgi:hypothetical protein
VSPESHATVIFERKTNKPVHLLYAQKSRLIHSNDLAACRILHDIVLLELMECIGVGKSFAFQHLDRRRRRRDIFYRSFCGL